MLIQELRASAVAAAPPGMRLGFDIVEIARVAESMECFGAAFEQRLFTPRELAYAHGGTGVAAQRLAARFAAKEAVIKALALAEAGVDWRDIEVERDASGECSLRLHGAVREAAHTQDISPILLCLSHDGEYAGAAVLFSCAPPSSTQPSPLQP